MYQTSGVLIEFSAELTQTLKDNFGTDKFDFLINNAGTGATIPFANATEDDFDRLLNVHFKGVYFLTQKLVGLMNDGGSIVNISERNDKVLQPGIFNLRFDEGSG